MESDNKNQSGRRILDTLDLLLIAKGGVENDVMRRLGIASSVFGSLRRSVWSDRVLTIRTKRNVYNACVWGTLKYGMEAWAIPAKLITKLEGFHNRCLRTIAGISRKQQREDRITSEQVRQKVGMPRTVAEMMRQQRLRWLGHVGRMGEDRLPYCMMFGKLQGRIVSRKKRWKDRIVQDLKEVGVKQEEWWGQAQDRSGWAEVCGRRGSVLEQETEMLKCGVCGKEGIRGKRGEAAHKRYCGGVGSMRSVPAEGMELVVGDGSREPTYKCSRCDLHIKSIVGTRRHAKACGKSRTASRGLSAAARQELTSAHQCLGCGRKFKIAAHLKSHAKNTKDSGYKLSLVSKVIN